MPTKPSAVRDYVASLPPDRRAAVEALRQVFRDNLDPAIEEGISYGMIGYFIPHRVYPAGYHCDPKQPLPFAGIASQKGHLSVHLMCVYGDPEEKARLEQAWAKAGKKLDMGAACIRFKRIEDIPLAVLGAAIRRVTAKKYIAKYEAALASRGKGTAGAAKPKAKAAKPKAKAAKPKAAAAKPKAKTARARR